MSFKITDRLKVNNSNFKFNDNLKSHITIGRTLEEYLTFPNIIIYAMPIDPFQHNVF
jgi:hypothetical protein